MTENIEAVAKRKIELESEKLDKEVKYLYMQKDRDSSYMQIGYKSGRTVTQTTTYNAD